MLTSPCGDRLMVNHRGHAIQRTDWTDLKGEVVAPYQQSKLWPHARLGFHGPRRRRARSFRVIRGGACFGPVLGPDYFGASSLNCLYHDGWALGSPRILLRSRMCRYGRRHINSRHAHPLRRANASVPSHGISCRCSILAKVRKRRMAQRAKISTDCPTGSCSIAALRDPADKTDPPPNLVGKLENAQ